MAPGTVVLAMALIFAAVFGDAVLFSAASDLRDGAVIVSPNQPDGAATEQSASVHDAKDQSIIASKQCCKALTVTCLACFDGVSEAEYCRTHPGLMGCGDSVDIDDRSDMTGSASNGLPSGPVGKGTKDEHTANEAASELVSEYASAAVAWDGPDFVATDEWQTVAEGQPIPPGLHVEIDMQTGKKKAKLMPDDERPGVLTVSERRARKLSQMEDAIASLGTQSSDDDNTKTAEATSEMVERYLNSLAEIKAKGIAVREDSETMADIIENLAKVVDDPEQSHTMEGDTNDDPVVLLFEKLEGLAHQYDNAIDLGKMGGYDVLARWLANPNASTDARGAAAIALGAACSNNPEAQEAATAAGVLPRLAAQLQAALSDKRLGEAKRMVHAIGAIVRGAPARVAALHNVGGLAVLGDALGSPVVPDPLRAKIARLIADIAAGPFSSAASGEKAGAGAADVGVGENDSEGIMRLLVNARLCDHVAPLLAAQQHSSADSTLVEATLGLASALALQCSSSVMNGMKKSMIFAMLDAAEGTAAALATRAAADPSDEYAAELSAEARDLVALLSTNDALKHSDEL